MGDQQEKASLINGVIILIGSVPAVLGYNVWSSFQPRGAGSTVLDLEDFIVSNLLLPGGAVVFLLFCMTGWGWGYENYLSEVSDLCDAVHYAGDHYYGTDRIVPYEYRN